MPKCMTSRERVLTALAHQEPDHVPCWLGASPEWKALARAHLGLPDDESLLVYLGDDFRRVFSRYAGPDHAHPTRNLCHPNATYRTPFGIERYGYGYGVPLVMPLKHARTVAEVEAYPWPDPEWVDVSHIRDEALQYERQYAILGGEWSPFWHDAIDLLDFDGLIYQMYDAPEIVDAVMGHCADYYLAVSRRIFEAAGDAIDIFFIGNDFGAQAGPMQRYGQIIGVKPEAFEEYKRYHAAVWPSVLKMIHECNIRNYSIFHKDNLLFAYFEYVGDDFAADMAKMAADPETQRWWAIMMPMQSPLPTRAEGEWWANMEEVFHTD